MTLREFITASYERWVFVCKEHLVPGRHEEKTIGILRTMRCPVCGKTLRQGNYTTATFTLMLPQQLDLIRGIDDPAPLSP